jgi:hypothetical protein
MAEGSINGNGIPCVFTRFSGAGRLQVVNAAKGWRAGAHSGEIPLDVEAVDIPQD